MTKANTMGPDAIRRHFAELRLTIEEAAQVLGISVAQAYRITYPESSSAHRKPTETVVRLIRAYLAGYRPRDWPETARQSKSPIPEYQPQQETAP